MSFLGAFFDLSLCVSPVAASQTCNLTIFYLYFFRFQRLIAFLFRRLSVEKPANGLVPLLRFGNQLERFSSTISPLPSMDCNNS